MANEPLSDGFQKAAESFRAAAEKAPDPAAKVDLLETADKMQQVHDKAHATWAQVQKTDNPLRTAMTPGHKTKTFWILIGVTLLILAFFTWLRYAA